MPMYNRDRVENAKWLVKFNRRTTNPQMQVWMAAKDDEVGMEEFCRGSECFQKGIGGLVGKWKMRAYETIRVELVCKAHGLNWECEIYERKA